MASKKKWLESVQSIGSIYRDSFDALKLKGMQNILSDVMYKKGKKAAKKFRGKSPVAIAKALREIYSAYNIKSKIAKKGNKEIVLVIENCEWSKLDGWEPEHCASIEFYERGIVQEMNPKVMHLCSCRKSLGKKECKIILRKS